MKSIFQNLLSVVKDKRNDKKFWEYFLEFAGLMGDAYITTMISKVYSTVFTTSACSVFPFFVTPLTVSGGAAFLAIDGIHDMVDAIVNMAKGSVAKASYEIRKKANELEYQQKELEDFAEAVKNMLPS